MTARTKAPRPRGRGGRSGSRSKYLGSARSPANEFDEGTRRYARRSLGNRNEVGFGISSAGDVEVRPRVAFCELLEKECGCGRTSRTSTRVLDVGDIGLDEILVLIPKR